MPYVYEARDMSIVDQAAIGACFLAPFRTRSYIYLCPYSHGLPRPSYTGVHRFMSRLFVLRFTSVYALEFNNRRCCNKMSTRFWQRRNFLLPQLLDRLRAG